MKPELEPLLSPFWMKAAQTAVLTTIVFSAIAFERWAEYPINPMIIGAWGFMGAYGFTLLWVRLEAWRISRGGLFTRR